LNSTLGAKFETYREALDVFIKARGFPDSDLSRMSGAAVTTIRGPSLPVHPQQQRGDGYALQEAGERIDDMLRKRRMPRQDERRDVCDRKEYQAQQGDSIERTCSISLH
jgi:hypothetical protein